MHIKNIKLHNFRNYEAMEVDFNPRLNIFVGENAQGKTNLLEAVQFVLGGYSFRSSKNEDLLNNESSLKKAKLVSSFIKNELIKDIDIDLEPTRAHIKINGKKVSRFEHRKQWGFILFTPDSLSLVKQGPQERREFLDQTIELLFKDKVDIINAFQKCLKTRNKILKNYAEGQLISEQARLLLQSINELFLSSATELIMCRLTAIKSLIPETKKLINELFNDAAVDILVDYVISGKSAIDWSQIQVYDALESRLAELQETEMKLGTSLVGPHKHDVRFLYNGRDARTYCSQGQQRSITLAFKIAQIEMYFERYKDYPVLLLDDVLSELDLERRNALVRVLKNTPTQIFISSTEWSVNQNLDFEDFKLFQITKGIAL